MSTQRLRHHTTPLTVESVQRMPGIRRITARNLRVAPIKTRPAKRREDMLLLAVLSAGVGLLLTLSLVL